MTDKDAAAPGTRIHSALQETLSPHPDAQMVEPGAVYDWLLGRWSFQRTIAGHASISGSAEIQPVSPNEGIYREMAKVTLVTGQILRGTQQYVYRRRADGLAIFFSDTERLFQSLWFRRLRADLVAKAVHHCMQDRYHSTYIVNAGSSLLVEHKVQGPAKSYISRTVYHRSSQSSSPAALRE